VLNRDRFEAVPELTSLMARLHMDVSYSNHDVDAHFHHVATTVKGGASVKSMLVDVKKALIMMRGHFEDQDDTETEEPELEDLEDSEPELVGTTQSNRELREEIQALVAELAETQRICDGLRRAYSTLRDVAVELEAERDGLLAQLDQSKQYWQQMSRQLAIEASRLSVAFDQNRYEGLEASVMDAARDMANNPDETTTSHGPPRPEECEQPSISPPEVTPATADGVRSDVRCDI